MALRKPYPSNLDDCPWASKAKKRYILLGKINERDGRGPRGRSGLPVKMRVERIQAKLTKCNPARYAPPAADTRPIVPTWLWSVARPTLGTDASISQMTST